MVSDSPLHYVLAFLVEIGSFNDFQHLPCYLRQAFLKSHTFALWLFAFSSDVVASSVEKLSFSLGLNYLHWFRKFLQDVKRFCSNSSCPQIFFSSSPSHWAISCLLSNAIMWSSSLMQLPSAFSASASLLNVLLVALFLFKIKASAPFNLNCWEKDLLFLLFLWDLVPVWLPLVQTCSFWSLSFCCNYFLRNCLDNLFQWDLFLITYAALTFPHHFWNLLGHYA